MYIYIDQWGCTYVYIYIFRYTQKYTDITSILRPHLWSPKGSWRVTHPTKNTPQMEADVAARRVVEQWLGCCLRGFFGGGVSSMPFKNGRDLKWGFGVGSFFFGFKGKRSGNVEDFVEGAFFFSRRIRFFCTHRKINTEPENDGLEDDFHLGCPYSQVPAINLPGCRISWEI